MNASPTKQFYDFIKDIVSVENDTALSDEKIDQYIVQFQKFFNQFKEYLINLSFPPSSQDKRRELEKRQYSAEAISFVSRISDELNLREDLCLERCFFKTNTINLEEAKTQADFELLKQEVKDSYFKDRQDLLLAELVLLKTQIQPNLHKKIKETIMQHLFSAFYPTESPMQVKVTRLLENASNKLKHLFNSNLDSTAEKKLVTEIILFYCFEIQPELEDVNILFRLLEFLTQIQSQQQTDFTKQELDRTVLLIYTSLANVLTGARKISQHQTSPHENKLLKRPDLFNKIIPSFKTFASSASSKFHPLVLLLQAVMQQLIENTDQSNPNPVAFSTLTLMLQNPAFQLRTAEDVKMTVGHILNETIVYPIIVFMNDFLKDLHSYDYDQVKNYQLGKITQIEHRFQDFVEFVAATHKESSELLFEVWNEGPLHLFINETLSDYVNDFQRLYYPEHSKLMITDKLGVCFELLDSLVSSADSAQLVYNFLNEERSVQNIVGWNPMIAIWKNKFDAFQSTTGNTPAELEFKDILYSGEQQNVLIKYLKLVEKIVTSSEDAKFYFCENQSELIHCLTDLLSVSYTTNALMGQIFKTLAVLAYGNNYAYTLWETIDKSLSVLVISQTLSDETILKTYPATLGFLVLLQLLFKTIPEEMGNSARFVEMIEFVISIVFCQSAREYSNAGERWILTEKCLDLFLLLLVGTAPANDATATLMSTILQANSAFLEKLTQILLLGEEQLEQSRQFSSEGRYFESCVKKVFQILEHVCDVQFQFLKNNSQKNSCTKLELALARSEVISAIVYFCSYDFHPTIPLLAIKLLFKISYSTEQFCFKFKREIAQARVSFVEILTNESNTLVLSSEDEETQTDIRLVLLQMIIKPFLPNSNGLYKQLPYYLCGFDYSDPTKSDLSHYSGTMSTIHCLDIILDLLFRNAFSESRPEFYELCLECIYYLSQDSRTVLPLLNYLEKEQFFFSHAERLCASTSHANLLFDAHVHLQRTYWMKIFATHIFMFTKFVKKFPDGSKQSIQYAIQKLFTPIVLNDRQYRAFAVDALETLPFDNFFQESSLKEFINTTSNDMPLINIAKLQAYLVEQYSNESQKQQQLDQSQLSNTSEFFESITDKSRDAMQWNALIKLCNAITASVEAWSQLVSMSLDYKRWFSLQSWQEYERILWDLSISALQKLQQLYMNERNHSSIEYQSNLLKKCKDSIAQVVLFIVNQLDTDLQQQQLNIINFDRFGTLLEHLASAILNSAAKEVSKDNRTSRCYLYMSMLHYLRYTEEIVKPTETNTHLNRKMDMKETNERVLFAPKLLPAPMFKDARIVMHHLVIILCKDATQSVRVWQASSLALLDRLISQFNTTKHSSLTMINMLDSDGLLQSLVQLVTTSFVKKSYEMMETNPSSILSNYESVMSCFISIALTREGSLALLKTNLVSELLHCHVVTVSPFHLMNGNSEQALQWMRRYHQILIPILKLVVALYTTNFELLNRKEEIGKLINVIYQFRKVFSELLTGRVQQWQQQMEENDVELASVLSTELHNFVLEEIALITECFCLLSTAIILNSSAVFSNPHWTKVKRLEPLFLTQLLAAPYSQQQQQQQQQDWIATTTSTSTFSVADNWRRQICKNAIIYCRNRMNQPEYPLEVLVALPFNSSTMTDSSITPFSLQHLYNCFNGLVEELSSQLQDWKHVEQPRLVNSTQSQQIVMKQCNDAIRMLQFMLENLTYIIDGQLKIVDTTIQNKGGVVSVTALLDEMNSMDRIKEQAWKELNQSVGKLKQYCTTESI